MGIISSLIIGAVAGIIAKALLGKRYSLIITIIIGCIGGFIGGIIFPDTYGIFTQIIVSALGAIIFLVVLGFFNRKSWLNVYIKDDLIRVIFF